MRSRRPSGADRRGRELETGVHLIKKTRDGEEGGSPSPTLTEKHSDQRALPWQHTQTPISMQLA